jgi:hypothetical protein
VRTYKKLGSSLLGYAKSISENVPVPVEDSLLTPGAQSQLKRLKRASSSSGVKLSSHLGSSPLDELKTRAINDAMEIPPEDRTREWFAGALGTALRRSGGAILHLRESKMQRKCRAFNGNAFQDGRKTRLWCSGRAKCMCAMIVGEGFTTARNCLTPSPFRNA